MNKTCDKHNRHMLLAIEEAKKSEKDVPVGVIIVQDDKIIAKAHNTKELTNDPTAHAEILAIKQAANMIGEWRLDNTIMYVTLEPCPMCAAAILYSRIPQVFFGAYDSLYGAFGSVINMTDLIKPVPKITGGIHEEKCCKLLKEFFEEQRHE